MPQLDFTIWLFNLTTNWLILTTLFVSFCNSQTTANITSNPKALSQENTPKWNWI
uniref:ATP synthase complex subunit 8 n=1 Tax=Ophiocomina nigra TaxID=55617 RepID=D3H5U1_9ECHI|nr:ATPase subunit 8 [Ophiocomina nigra]